jgi:hypothetical protein
MNHMKIHPENENDTVKYSRRWNEYSIDVNENIQQKIYYCPWCGEKLPNSHREKWFDNLEAMGIDPMNDNIPEEFQDEAWYIEI